MNDNSILTNTAEFSTYFSHSYRAQDLVPNLFFWHLFCEYGFFFEVDPRNDFLSIPYLECMMHRSSCFVAVVTFREEEKYTRCSPYILFEYGLAVQAKKPKLVFVEKDVSQIPFRGNIDELIVFNRNLLEQRKKKFGFYLQNLTEKARGYQDIDAQLHKKIGIIIDPEKNADKVYSNTIFELLAQEIDKLGYSLKRIGLNFKKSFDFCIDIDECDLLICDEQTSLVSPWISGYLFGRFIPCIRLCHITKNSTLHSVKLSPLITKYYNVKHKSNKLESIIYWHNTDELILETTKHLSKLEQKSDIFKTKEEGDKYFRNLGRRKAKVFISHADKISMLAEELSRNLKAEYIDYFHYKAQDAIEIGDRWRMQLDKELEKCGIFVALINKDYIQKKWCKYELDFALVRHRQGKTKIFSYFLDEPIPASLEAIQGSLIMDWPNDKIINLIIDDLDNFLKK